MKTLRVTLALAVAAAAVPAAGQKFPSGQGPTPHGNTPEEYAGYTKAEAVKWKKLIGEAGVKIK